MLVRFKGGIRSVISDEVWIVMWGGSWLSEGAIPSLICRLNS